jgi:hypothetical protein
MLKPEQKVDMVDIFRNSAAAGAIMDEAVELFIPVIWTQLGVVDDAAALRAKEKGATVIVDRCPKVSMTYISESIGIDLDLHLSIYTCVNIYVLTKAFYFCRVRFRLASSHVHTYIHAYIHTYIHASRLSSKRRLATQRVYTTFSVR